jgi:curli biogenesis system outer membrane secretion channel CsgG
MSLNNKRISCKTLIAVLAVMISNQVRSQSTAVVHVTPPASVNAAHQNTMANLGSFLQIELDANTSLTIVDRSEILALMDEREFAQMMSSPQNQIPTGLDAAADYLITVQVLQFGSTGVKRGALLSQFTGRATARVVQTTNGAPVASVTANIEDFFRNDTDAMVALAKQLSQQIEKRLENHLKGTTSDAAEAQMQILRIRPDGTVMISHESGGLAAGDRLQIYDVEEFEDPRTPGVLLRDEIPVGVVEIIRVSSGFVTARPVRTDANLAALMLARKKAGSGGSHAAAAHNTPAPPSSADHRADLMRGRGQNAVRPSLHVGLFRYSNEFNLSQTADRGARPGSNDASGATLGAIAGGVARGGGPSEWIPGAIVGGIAGSVADQERQRQSDISERRKQDARDEQSITSMDRSSPVLREMVITKATASQRFDVVENIRMDEIFAQMDQDLDGNFDPNRLPQRGQLQGAKYSVFGTILRFETNRRQTGFGVAGGREQVEMSITLALRVVDNETGRMEISDQITSSIVTGSQQTGFLGFGTSSENQGAIGELLDNLSQDIIAKIVTTLYPIQIINVNHAEQTVILNAGETILSRNDRLRVFETGEQIVDPYSGMILGNAETEIAEILITETHPGFSRGRITRLRPNANSPLAAGQICRPVVNNSSNAVPQRRGF